jgi:hypothetical protein
MRGKVAKQLRREAREVTKNGFERYFSWRELYRSMKKAYIALPSKERAEWRIWIMS